MSRLRDKLDLIYKPESVSAPEIPVPSVHETTRQRLERLVQSKLRQQDPVKAVLSPREDKIIDTSVTHHAGAGLIGPVRLADWASITRDSWSVLFPTLVGDCDRPFSRPLFIDTETTGLSGGTGTLPFMIGSGYFDDDRFTVKVMTLLEPSKEAEFLRQWLALIDEVQPDCLVSFNGRAFDMPLIESRFILSRIPFNLDRLPHLDFLYPARSLWGWTFPSRRLGILGEELLGLSREGDIAGEFIPALYFDFLRRKRLSMLEPVIRHNGLDIVGLAALIVLAASYLEQPQTITRSGEHLGTAILFERCGEIDRAELALERELGSCRERRVKSEATKRLAICRKRQKRYTEAAALWRELLPGLDKRAFWEMIVHIERREGDPDGAAELIREALRTLPLTQLQSQKLEERLARLAGRKRKAAAGFEDPQTGENLDTSGEMGYSEP